MPITSEAEDWEVTLIQHVDAGLGLIVGLIVLLIICFVILLVAVRGKRGSSAVKASVSTDTTGLSGDVVLITIDAESSATIETRDKTILKPVSVWTRLS